MATCPKAMALSCSRGWCTRHAGHADRQHLQHVRAQVLCRLPCWLLSSLRRLHSVGRRLIMSLGIGKPAPPSRIRASRSLMNFFSGERATKTKAKKSSRISYPTVQRNTYSIQQHRRRDKPKWRLSLLELPWSICRDDCDSLTN